MKDRFLQLLSSDYAVRHILPAVLIAAAAGAFLFPLSDARQGDDK